MSVEAPKTVEETPVVDTTKAAPEVPETSAAPAVETAAAPAESSAVTETAPAAATEDAAAAPATTEEVKKDEAVVEAVPTSEGVLGYKEPGFFKKFIYTKHFFWFSEEPATTESLTTFLRQEKEKADTKHSAAAWARETGKGLIFYAKRSEDKAVPAGVINLSDASAVTKEGLQQFSFKAGNHQHRFEATTSKERDSWIVAVEKAIQEAKEIKDEITGRESYKKNVEEYSKPAFIPAAAATKSSRSKSKEPKKSLDVATATTAPAGAAAETASTSSSSADEATKAAKKDKERSQSRKRGSIFGSLLGKKDEHADKKEEKAEVKKELKEEKKVEAEEKKEEAKASEEPTASPAVEAAEASTAAAAIAAAPAAAVVAASDKKEEKEEPTVAPAEKRAKRGSVFGSLFKKSVTSPSTEKTEKEATTSDTLPVSETAPKLDEPIENKPIDTAAVTAPADNVETPAAATTEEPAKDVTTTPAAAESTTTTKPEKKGGLLGFIKKTEAKLEGKKEHKEEAKEEQAAETIAKDPVAAAAVPETATETTPTTEPVTATEPAAKEERPARDGQRRTSLFFNKNKKEATSDGEGATETKREKSPNPGKFIGDLVRRASKAVKSEPPKEKTATTEPAAKEVAVETPSAAPAAPTEPTETKIVGDVVPETLTATPETAAPAAAPEVKATA